MEEMAAVTPMVRTSLENCIVSISSFLLTIDQATYHYTTLFNPSLNQQRLWEDGVIFFDSSTTLFPRWLRPMSAFKLQISHIMNGIRGIPPFRTAEQTPWGSSNW